MGWRGAFFRGTATRARQGVCCSWPREFNLHQIGLNFTLGMAITHTITTTEFYYSLISARQLTSFHNPVTYSPAAGSQPCLTANHIRPPFSGNEAHDPHLYRIVHFNKKSYISTYLHEASPLIPSLTAKVHKIEQKNALVALGFAAEAPQ